MYGLQHGSADYQDGNILGELKVNKQWHRPSGCK